MEGSDAGRLGHLEPEDIAFMGFRTSSEKPVEEIRADGAIVRKDGSILRADFSRQVEAVMGEDY